MTVLQIEQMYNFDDQNLADFFNLEQVNFSVAPVIYSFTLTYKHLPGVCLRL